MKTKKPFLASVATAIFALALVAGPLNLDDQFKTSIDKDKVEVPKQGSN